MPHRYTFLLLSFFLLSSAFAQDWSVELTVGLQSSQILVPEVVYLQDQSTVARIGLNRHLGSRLSFGLDVQRFSLAPLTRYATRNFLNRGITCCFGPCNFTDYAAEIANDPYLPVRERFWSATVGARYTQPLFGRFFLRVGTALGLTQGQDIEYSLTSEHTDIYDVRTEYANLETASVDHRPSPTYRGEMGLGVRLWQRYQVGIQLSYQATHLRAERKYESYVGTNNILEISDPLPLRQLQLGATLAYRW